MTRNPAYILKRTFKPYSRASAKRYRGFRRRLNQGANAPWFRKRLDKALDYFDLFVLDHHIFRAIYANRHQIAPGVWRSSQPSPSQIKRYARLGIRTIINLRGERDCGSYRLEEEACKRHGIKLVNFVLQSRMAPSLASVEEARELFHTVEYPILVHCKSGADRVGMMSAFLLYFKEGKSLRKAMKQLHLKYGHFKKSDTGILDYVFERYLHDRQTLPITFHEWLETYYDPSQLKKEFRANGWANLVVNHALKRE